MDQTSGSEGKQLLTVLGLSIFRTSSAFGRSDSPMWTAISPGKPSTPIKREERKNLKINRKKKRDFLEICCLRIAPSLRRRKRRRNNSVDRNEVVNWRDIYGGTLRRGPLVCPTCRSLPGGNLPVGVAPLGVFDSGEIFLRRENILAVVLARQVVGVNRNFRNSWGVK